MKVTLNGHQMNTLRPSTDRDVPYVIFFERHE